MEADKDIADCLRGQSNPLKARSCLKLLKLRVASREQSDDDHPEEQAWDNDGTSLPPPPSILPFLL